jgi:hypothetical protein
MPRGITETDVWTACDALVLAGERPTIERVRQKIGRGSPNTVTPMLDAWFKGLGARISDPGAFALPPGAPDVVVQAAKHLWEVAQADTRRDFDQRVSEAMAAAVANVEAEKERASTAEAAAYAAVAKLTRAEAELAEHRALLEQERTHRAADLARLDEAKGQIERLVAEAREAAAAMAQERSQARQAIDAAQERSAAAQRRANLEIDSERMARAKADKRAEVAEARAEAALAQARDTERARLEISAKLQSQEARWQERQAMLEERLEDERCARQRGDGQLVAALDRAKAAEHEVKVLQKIVAQFGPKSRSPRRAVVPTA